MSARRLALAGAAGLALVTGCAATPLHIVAMDEVEHVREGAGAKEGAALAPEVYARAEQERRFSIAAHASGDDVAATLHAERALAAYEHALVVARVARSTGELADARKALDDTTAQEQAVEASRAQLDADAQNLENELRIARGRLLPAASSAAPGDREAARRVAARTMATEAHLLCGAAQLVAADGARPEPAADLDKLDDRLGKGATPAPIDDSARLRARCLDALTKARRDAGGDAGTTDALLAELSAAGGWDPARDERGVVVTLHDAFTGAGLSSTAAAKLKDLARVAAAHPALAVQLVVHGAGTAGAGPDAQDPKRAEAAAAAFTTGSAATKMQTQLAGSRAPLVDPADAKARGRNERLDVVFVAH